MSQDTLTLTFPMIMFAIFSVAGGVLAWAIKKWVADTEKSRDLKDSEVHESFKLMGMKLDDERDKREALKETVFEVKLSMATMVKREEMSDLYNRIDQIHKDVIAALALKAGGQ